MLESLILAVLFGGTEWLIQSVAAHLQKVPVYCRSVPSINVMNPSYVYRTSPLYVKDRAWIHTVNSSL